MTSAKKKIFSVLLVVLLLAATLSTMSACNIRKWKEGESVHKDGVYYTVYLWGRHATAHGFDKQSGDIYEIPSRIKYKGIKCTVTEFSAAAEIGRNIVCDDGVATELIVPNTVRSLNLSGFRWDQLDNLQAVTISADNPCYTSIDGVVYSRDKSELLYYPPAKSNHALLLPKETTIISDSLSSKSKLAFISVESGNASYSAQDGVLLTADGTRLVCYPLNKTDATYVIPQKLSVLNTRHLERNEYLKYLEVEQGNATFSAYNGDLYSADGSILLYRPNEDVRYLELPDGVTTIGYGTLNRVRYLYVPKSLQRVVFDAYYRYDDENATNPMGDIKYVYCESNELPICLRYTKFTGSVSFSVSREQFQAEIERARSEGLL